METKARTEALCTEGHELTRDDLSLLKSNNGDYHDRTLACPRDKCAGYVRVPSKYWVERILEHPERFDPYLVKMAGILK